jgi:hypothetical protein
LTVFRLYDVIRKAEVSEAGAFSEAFSLNIQELAFLYELGLGCLCYIGSKTRLHTVNQHNVFNGRNKW